MSLSASASSQPPHYVRYVGSTGDVLTLTPGQYYQILPDPAEADGMLRVIDNTGEDYLYEAVLFEDVDDPSRLTAALTVTLNPPAKAAILQLAGQRGVSMAALVREWIDERLDLPAHA